jgi:hypothetical protein
VTLTAISVALCLSYRSPCALIAWSSERFADTPETQWEQGRAVLYCRQSQWQDVGHLHEKEECRRFHDEYQHRLIRIQLDSVFRVLEPVIGKINEKTKAQPSIGSRFGLRSQRSEWFRVYRVGFTFSLLRHLER